MKPYQSTQQAGAWLVDIPYNLTPSRKRKRKQFSSKMDALRFVAELQEKIGKVGMDGVVIEGMTLDAAISLYLSEKSVSHQEMLDSKAVLDSFLGYAGCVVLRTIKGTDIAAFLKTIKKSATTIYNYYAKLRAFFNWCERRDYVLVAPTRKCDVPRRGDPERGHLTVDDARRLVEAVVEDDDLCPFVLLGLFAGLRSEEIRRLDWSAIEWENGEIFIGKKVVKRGKALRPRVVPITAPLVRYLRPVSKPSGLVIPNPSESFIYKPLRALFKRLNMEMPKNYARHTFCTYALGHYKDAAKVSLWAGNSPDTLFRHYAEAARSKDSSRFWEI